MINLNLKRVVDSKGLTMTDVHKGTGISKNTLSTMANGLSKGIQFDTLDKLLEYLSVNIEELIVFTSKSEVESLKVKVIEKEILDITKDREVENIFAPAPKKEEKESSLEYGNRIDKLEYEIIGKTTELEVISKFEVTIHFEDFSYIFDIYIKYLVTGVKNKKDVKEAYINSLYCNGEKFEDYLLNDQKFFIISTSKEKTMRNEKMFRSGNLINKNRNISKYLNRVRFTNIQKEIIFEKIENSVVDSVPQEITDFIKENDIDFNEKMIFLS